MTAKHTLGPWNLEAISFEVAGRANYILSEEMEGPFCRLHTSLGDARLIAAAPELLEACKKAFQEMKKNWIDLGDRGDELNLHPYWLLKDAIEKAEGQ